MKISVVLPIFRTAASLNELYARLQSTFVKLGHDYELLMVDDGSPDGAWPMIQKIAVNDKSVKAFKLSRNFGQHPAIAAGLEHVTGDVVVLMDADLQDRPEDIPKLLAALTENVDVVYTVKEVQLAPWHIRWTSSLYHSVIGRLTSMAIPRHIGSFRLFNRRFFEALMCYPERNILFGPIMFHMGFEYAVVQVPNQERKHGRTSYSFRKRLSLAFNSIISYTDLPHRLLIKSGVGIFACSAFYSLIVLVNYALGMSTLMPGLTLVVLLLTFMLGTIMFSLGLIGSYVFNAYQEVLRRPRFHIARSVNVEAITACAGRKPWQRDQVSVEDDRETQRKAG
jgi:dolichol-phosphate mannosyltransferase